MVFHYKNTQDAQSLSQKRNNAVVECVNRTTESSSPQKVFFKIIVNFYITDLSPQNNYSTLDPTLPFQMTGQHPTKIYLSYPITSSLLTKPDTPTCTLHRGVRCTGCHPKLSSCGPPQNLLAALILILEVLGLSEF